ncbi:MAG: SUMF1/EgtB/PvdO family nonheme iron enzyme [Pirellula sp.]|nr:SUMF1/EgtB/PvdO family nonheme iron enzyme [Pirellula sp.]
MRSSSFAKRPSAWARVLGVATVSTVAASMVSTVHAGVVSFGSGDNQFNMEFVTIGSPGNAADTTGDPNPAGAVGYTYGIGKFEVKEDMIEKYNALNPGLQISKDTRGLNKPATSVSWNEAARFVNWLNTSTGNQAAYKFTSDGVNDDIALWVSGDAGYDALNPYRNSLAKYFLPSYNEWYKAAYYNPTNSTYYNFPNGSDTMPVSVESGTDNNTAVYTVFDDFYNPVPGSPNGPADVDKAGGLSPFGVMGLGGNVSELEESPRFLGSFSGSSSRGVRGGTWKGFGSSMSVSSRNSLFSDSESVETGFRVATLSSSPPPAVPEPSMMVIGTLFGIGGLMAKRRTKK